MSDSLPPRESQHARPPCPSPTPGVHSDSRPLSQWCHPAISSSVVPFSSCPQSLPASESFPMSQLFAWGGQRTGVSALASFLSKNTQGWSPSESRSVLFNSLWPHGLYSPWNSPGQNTGVGSLSLLQGIFLTQELNQGLLHCRQIIYQLNWETLMNPMVITNQKYRYTQKKKEIQAY